MNTAVEVLNWSLLSFKSHEHQIMDTRNQHKEFTIYHFLGGATSAACVSSGISAPFFISLSDLVSLLLIHLTFPTNETPMIFGASDQSIATMLQFQTRPPPHRPPPSPILLEALKSLKEVLENLRRVGGLTYISGVFGRGHLLRGTCVEKARELPVATCIYIYIDKKSS